LFGIWNDWKIFIYVLKIIAFHFEKKTPSLGFNANKKSFINKKTNQPMNLRFIYNTFYYNQQFKAMSFKIDLFLTRFDDKNSKLEFFNDLEYFQIQWFNMDFFIFLKLDIDS
jgi:hypothetical protein